MNEADLKPLLDQAIANLFEHQPNIYDFTPESGQTEWNLAHHLAVELREFFPAMDHDLEITKHDFDNKRPDIIFHKRGTHASNHLVIELKRDGSDRDLEADRRKIEVYWFQPPLNYEFGAVINLRSDKKSDLRVLKNPAQ